MKKLDLASITGSTGMPLKKGTLLHIVESQREVIDGLIQGLASYTTGNVVILYGCVITGANPGVISNTAGAIFYNGEVYLVEAQTFTTTGANIPAWTIIETSVSGTGYDTVLLTSGSAVSIHKDRKFKLVNSPIGGSGVVGYVADYNGSAIRYLNEQWSNGGYVSIITPVVSSSVVINYFAKKRFQNTMFLNAKFTITYGASGQVNDEITIANLPALLADVPSLAPLGIFTARKTTTPFTASTGSVVQSSFNVNNLAISATIGTITSGDVFVYTIILQYPCSTV